MAPTTRGKRPADADPASPLPAKQPRKTRGQTAVDAKAKAESIDDADEAPEPEVKKPAPRKGRGKANVKSEPVDDEDADVVEPAKAKAAPKKGGAKAKADAGPTKDEQADDAEPETKAAPKKGRGKSKVKEEPAEDDQDEVKPAKDSKAASTNEAKEAQVAKAGTSQIPLDEGCYLTTYHVYVDPNDSLIYDAALNQTNASGNNNKFYRVQVS